MVACAESEFYRLAWSAHLHFSIVAFLDSVISYISNILKLNDAIATFNTDSQSAG